MTKPITRIGVSADMCALIDFASQTLQATGAAQQPSQVTAEVLVEADASGVESHGISRLGRYLTGLRSGLIDGHAEFTVPVDAGALLMVDGHNGLGPSVFQYATDLAIERAAEQNLAVVFVRNSNHMGMTGWFTRRAAAHGLFALACTNGVPLVAPMNTKSAMFGTNPISYSLSTDSDHLTFDGATGIVSRGKLEQLARSGGSMLDDWVVDTDGRPVTDLNEAIEGLEGGFRSAIRPIGGATTARGGHKGSGLSMLVELLCGPIAGGPWSRYTHLADQPAQVGHFMFCLRPGAVTNAAHINSTVDAMLREIRESDPADPSDPARVPGDRRQWVREARKDGGIPLSIRTVEILIEVSETTGVPLPINTNTSAH